MQLLENNRKQALFVAAAIILLAAPLVERLRAYPNNPEQRNVIIAQTK